MVPAETQSKLERLKEIVAGYGSALVTFSGGVDSTFLLKIASDTLGERCHAVTCVSVTMASSERDDAVKLGTELGLAGRHHVIESNELEQPGFASNPKHRCALCKTELMDVAGPIADDHQLDAVLLGTNTDDLGDYRPGIQAASDRGAHAPMVAARLSKDEIRILSRSLGLRTWSKPQLACLSSRFPYGTEITPERLRRVDRFEDGLRKLGFTQLRVRFHEPIARLELLPEEMPRAFELRETLDTMGRELGFRYVTIDLRGFRSGSLNETLVPLSRRRPKAS